MTESPVATPRPVLVLYAPADEAFVRGYFLPALGPASGARGDQPIDACDLSTIEIGGLERALESSSVTIAVISPAFLANPWSRLSESLASGAAVEHDLELIPLVLESCELPLHIREKVSLDFRFRGEWDDQARRLRDHLERPPPVEAPLPCPYPGMRPYEAADARYFHGRTAEIAAVVGLVVGGAREIYLVGPSGCGKSSLIAAGVVPRLAAEPGAAELVVRAMRPGDAPLRRLAECLDVAEPDAAAVAAWAAGHPGARLVIFIDQLEELFTVASLDEQARFAAALSALRAEPRCLLVLAVRADFYAELMQSQLWLDGSRRHVDLVPLQGAALRAAIERPARALDVYLEPDLVERLLADAAGEPGVLPLLQETLVQLWNRRRRRRLLTLTEYEALGEGGRSGLAVAISSRADRCLRELTPARVAIARRLLLRLVSFGDGRPNTRRRQTRVQLATDDAPAELDAVLRHLVAARLLTMDGTGSAEDDLVDLCHDVLIIAWPSFTMWVEARRADEQRRRQIQSSADEWIARGRGASGLLDEGELAAAIAWRRTDAARELGESAEVTALIDASRDAAARARRRRRRALASVGAGLVVFAAVTATLAWVAQRRATVAELERNRAEAERQRAEVETGKAVRMLGEQYLEVARQVIAGGQHQRALPYLLAARERGVDDISVRALFRIATTSSVVATMKHGGAVTSATFSADGTQVVTASMDGTARVWDASSGAPVTGPLTHPGPVTFATMRNDGARVLTISQNAAWIWNATSMPPTVIPLRHAAPVNGAAFSADGTMVVTASDDQTAQLWITDTGDPLAPPLRHQGKVASAALDRDAKRIVTTLRDGKVEAIWNAITSRPIAKLRKNWPIVSDSEEHLHDQPLFTAAFSRDGTRIVTTSIDETALRWNAATGAVITPAIEHSKVQAAVFDPAGERIATAGADGRVRLWDAATAKPVGQPLEHPAEVLDLEYSRDGTQLLTQSNDKYFRVWEVASGTLTAAVDVEGGVFKAALDPEGRRVVTASVDGFARVWKLGSLAPRVVEKPFVRWAVYGPDGSTIVTGGNDGGVRVRSPSGTRDLNIHGLLGLPALFDAEGTRLALFQFGGAALVGPLDDPGIGIPHHVRGERPEPEPRSPPPDRERASSIAAGAFSPDGKRVAATGEHSSARVWDTASGAPVTPRLLHDAQVNSIRFSPDGRRVVTASDDGTARVWDASTGVEVAPRLGHAEEWVMFALFSPDGRWIVTTASDKKVRVWDAASHQLRSTMTGHAGMILATDVSPDSALILTGSLDQSARIWNLATGALVVPPLEHRESVDDARFSPEGARVLTLSGKRVQVWDVRTGRPIGAPFEHPEYIGTARFSPDGNSVLTTDGTVRVWDASLDGRSLDDWVRVVGTGAYPELASALERSNVDSH